MNLLERRRMLQSSIRRQSIDGRFQVICGHPLLYSEDYGKTWKQDPDQMGWTSACVSADGTCALVSGYTEIMLWFAEINIWLIVNHPLRNLETSCLPVVMSSDGNHSMAVPRISSYSDMTTNLMEKNDDHGGVGTWTTVEVDPNLRFPENIYMSASGQFAGIVDSHNAFLSSDHGQTWRSEEIGSSYDVDSVIRYSADGKYMLIVSQKNVFRSEDYGQTLIHMDTAQYLSDTNAAAISDSGEYQAWARANGSSTKLVVLTQYGKDSNKGWYKKGIIRGLAMSSDGRHICFTTTKPDGLYISDDYGQTFRLVGKTLANGALAMSATGKHITAVLQGSKSKVSTSHDYGKTWSTAVMDSTYNGGDVVMNRFTEQ